LGGVPEWAEVLKDPAVVGIEIDSDRNNSRMALQPQHEPQALFHPAHQTRREGSRPFHESPAVGDGHL
jgi:hypothetical protein